MFSDTFLKVLQARAHAPKPAGARALGRMLRKSTAGSRVCSCSAGARRAENFYRKSSGWVRRAKEFSEQGRLRGHVPATRCSGAKSSGSYPMEGPCAGSRRMLPTPRNPNLSFTQVFGKNRLSSCRPEIGLFAKRDPRKPRPELAAKDPRIRSPAFSRNRLQNGRENRRKTQPRKTRRRPGQRQ